MKYPTLLRPRVGLPTLQIAAKTGAETRVTVLGQIQRGGIPSPVDRLLGSAFGVAAVDLIAQGKFAQMVA